MIDTYINISNYIAGPMHMNWFDLIMIMIFWTVFTSLIIRGYAKSIN